MLFLGNFKQITRAAYCKKIKIKKSEHNFKLSSSKDNTPSGAIGNSGTARTHKT